MLDVVGGNSFLQSNAIQGLSNSTADLHKWSLFSASLGPPTREVESRSSPQAPHVGSSAPSLPGTCRESGESFTTLLAPLRVTFSLHRSIEVITCVLAHWLYPCAICKYRAFKSMHILSHVTDMQPVRLCLN